MSGYDSSPPDSTYLSSPTYLAEGDRTSPAGAQPSSPGPYESDQRVAASPAIDNRITASPASSFSLSSDPSVEDEEESALATESGSDREATASGSEAGYTDLDADDLFNEVDHDTGFDASEDFGPIYDSDWDDAAEWLRQRDHLHHHYHHHHHHGHGFAGLEDELAHLDEDEDAEESLFVDDDDHHEQVLGEHLGFENWFDDDYGLGDLEAIEVLNSLQVRGGQSPPPPGYSHSGTPLHDILEAAAVFGAESLFREPREGSIRDQLIQFHQNNAHLHNVATNHNRNTATNMDRLTRDRDELVRMELGSGAGSRSSRSRRSQQPSQGPSAAAEVIDLTLDDAGSSPQPMLPFPPAAPVRPPRANTRRSAQRSVPPPNLTRSDTRYVDDGPNVINLVSDDEDEVTATGPTINAGTRPPGSRRHNPPRAAASRPAPIEPRAWGLPNMHSLFRPVFSNFISRRTQQHRPSDNSSDDIAFMGQRNLHPHSHTIHRHGFGPLSGLSGFNIPGFGTIDLNYAATPFPNRHGPPATPKPKHEPPKAAREGFTRDTGDEIVAMCPSCEEELAYDPDDNDAADSAGPPAKKARTRRDKAEHHFFAVKGCGHVYCRKCYEGRGQSTRSAHYTGFHRPPSSDGRAGKKTFCAVDGCGEEVGNKSAWVGIFL